MGNWVRDARCDHDLSRTGLDAEAVLRAGVNATVYGAPSCCRTGAGDPADFDLSHRTGIMAACLAEVSACAVSLTNMRGGDRLRHDGDQPGVDETRTARPEKNRSARFHCASARRDQGIDAEIGQTVPAWNAGRVLHPRLQRDVGLLNNEAAAASSSTRRIGCTPATSR